MAKTVDLSQSGSGEGEQTYGFKSIIRFGKYKGDSVQTIIKKDPKYLIWLNEKVEWFSLDDEVLEAVESASDRHSGDYEDTYDRFNRWDKD